MSIIDMSNFFVWMIFCYIIFYSCWNKCCWNRIFTAIYFAIRTVFPKLYFRSVFQFYFISFFTVLSIFLYHIYSAIAKVFFQKILCRFWQFS